MKVLIEMPLEHYETFLDVSDITSREYTILKNSVVAQEPVADPGRSIVQILCNEDEALKLLGSAIQIYPEVVQAITAAIDRARKS
jgi:hypothetical protein